MERILLVLLIGHIIGVAFFGKFEAESPWWRAILKWSIIMGIIYGVSAAFGAGVTMYVLIGLFVVSLIVHFTWCHMHGIHPIQATPRKKYFELRGWTWRE
jgi:hypothetical protein